METIENLLRFLNSYPIWAKGVVAGGLVAILLVLVFASRAGEPGPVIDQSTKRYFLAVRGITLYTDDPSADVQVFIDVNGQEFKFPSVAGVEWMKVGPAMNQKTVEIAPSPVFVVSFRMKLRSTDGRRTGTLNSREQLRVPGPSLFEFSATSQSMVHVPSPKLPYSGSYDLYNVVDGVRSAAVSARIRFDVFLAD